MVNLPIVKTFIKMISPKKFEKFFSQKCTINGVCCNSDVLDTFFIKISFFFFNISELFSKCNTEDNLMQYLRSFLKTNFLPNIIAKFTP